MFMAPKSATVGRMPNCRPDGFFSGGPLFSKPKTSLAAAGIATLAAATTAQAAIVTVDAMTPFAFGQKYDLDGDGVDDIQFGEGASSKVLSEFSAQTKGSPPTGLAALLGAGDSVPTGIEMLSGSSSLLQTGSSSSDIPTGPLAPLPNSGFIGIRFPGSGTLLEGWLQFAATGATWGEVEIVFVSYGYEGGGGAITMTSAAIAERGCAGSRGRCRAPRASGLTRRPPRSTRRAPPAIPKT